EKGIFDALEKQYLKSFVFAIYLDEKDPKNLVEAYTFNVSYHKIDGTDIQVPALTLETSISKLNLEQLDSSAAVTKSNRPPTLGEVKKSVRVLIKGIVSMSQTLDELPDHRFATFKIYYNDHTPSEYEPPHFVAGDAEKDRFFFSTHSVREAPERSLCGESNTGGHSVRVDVTSIVDRLPHESNSATFTGHTNVNDSNQTFRQVEAKRKADIKIQLDDAKNRQVVWDAELADEEVPFGVRQEGEIVPIPWKGKGKDSPIRHRGGQHHVPGLDDAGASSSAPAGEATQLLETQATFVIPPSDISPTQEYENTQRDAVMDEAQGSAGTSDSTKPTEVQSQGPSAQDEAMADIRIHPAIDPAILRWKSVDCYCGIDDDTSETFVCQGACARRLHTWCMAYASFVYPFVKFAYEFARFNTAEEVASAEDSTCVECTLRADPVYGLMSDKNRQRFSRDLAILAIYRRTIKLVYEHGYPGNPTALHKLVGCTRPDAVNNTKRMEDEGFLEARITEFDPLGLIASSVPAKSVKNAKKKANKKAAKPQLVVVKTAAVKRQFERYFEPQGEIMTDLLKSYRPTKDKAPNAPPAQDTPAGNVLVPSSR
ncbi:DNA binding protein, partial [Ceratobasidium sp. 428]